MRGTLSFLEGTYLRGRPLCCVCLSLLIASCGGGEAGRTNGDTGRADQAGGHLDVRIHPVEGRQAPPADLLVLDPMNRRVGKVPRHDRVFAEIPDASYESEGIANDVTGAAGPETRIVWIGNAVSGEYKLHVLGTENAAYHLELRGVDRDLSPSTVRFLDIDIETGSEHRYTIEYSSTPGSEIRARRD